MPKNAAKFYFGLFEEVLGAYPSIPDTMFIMDIGDMPTPSQDIPIFQFQEADWFQRHFASGYRFYLGLITITNPWLPITSPIKKRRLLRSLWVCTSGQRNTVETVRAPVAPRLRIAKHFRGHPDIHVLLTTLTRVRERRSRTRRSAT